MIERLQERLLKSAQIYFHTRLKSWFKVEIGFGDELSAIRVVLRYYFYHGGVCSALSWKGMAS